MRPCCCPRVRSHPNYALVVVTAALFLDYLLLLAMVPVLPVYATSLLLSPTAVGFLFSVKPIAGVVASPLMGLLSDKAGRRLPMVLGLFGAAAFTILFAFSTTFWQLIVSRLLQGVASASNTAAFALLTDAFPDPKVRGSKMAIAITGISLGVLLGPIYGGLLYEAGGVRLPFFIGAGLLALDGMCRMLAIEPHRGGETTKSDAGAAATVSSAADGSTPTPLLSPPNHSSDITAWVGSESLEGHVVPAPPTEQGLVELPPMPPGASADDKAASRDNSDVDTMRKPRTPENDSPSVGATDVNVSLPEQTKALSSAGSTLDTGALQGTAADGTPRASIVQADCPSSATMSPGSSEEPLPPVARGAVTYTHVLANRRVLTLCCALLFANGAIALMEVVLPLYLSERLGLSAGAIGGLYAGGNALYVIITNPAARLGARIGRWKLIALGCVLMGVPMPLMSLIPSLYWIVPLWLICSGLGMSLVDTSCRCAHGHPACARAPHTPPLRCLAPLSPPRCPYPAFLWPTTAPSFQMSQRRTFPVPSAASLASHTPRPPSALSSGPSSAPASCRASQRRSTPLSPPSALPCSCSHPASCGGLGAIGASTPQQTLPLATPRGHAILQSPNGTLPSF
jgi:MFS family permease